MDAPEYQCKECGLAVVFVEENGERKPVRACEHKGAILANVSADLKISSTSQLVK